MVINWTTLSVTVTTIKEKVSVPIENLTVTFHIFDKNKRVYFTITAVTNSNGVATITNLSSNTYIKEDKSNKMKNVTNSDDFDFENLSGWYASYTYNGFETNTSSLNLVNGNNSMQSTPRATNYNPYTRLQITVIVNNSGLDPSVYNNTYVRCFFYNINDEFLGKLTCFTENQKGEVDLTKLNDYQSISYIKFNAYKSGYPLVYFDTILNDINNSPTNAISFIGDTSTGILTASDIPLQIGSNNYNVYIRKVIAADYLAYCTGNVCPLYVNSLLEIKNPQNTLIWSGSTLWTSFDVNSQYTITGLTLTCSVSADTDYFYNEKLINIFDYPAESISHSTDAFIIDGVIIEMLKDSYTLRLPRILDTVKIRDTIQYPTAIYNLKDTAIKFSCPLKGGFRYTQDTTSNAETITFDYTTIGNDYTEVINKIGMMCQPGTLVGDVATFTLSKHHYIDNKYYAVAGCEMTYVNDGNQHYTVATFFFVDYQLRNNVPVTAITATSIYNSIIDSTRSGGNNRSQIRYINWGDYENSPILPLPYEMIYMVIKRERYVCPREKEINDYFNGFSYNETGAPYTAVSNFKLTAYTQQGFDGSYGVQKLYTAKLPYLNACMSKVGQPSISNIEDYKSEFVDLYLCKGTRYGTDYTKRNLYDSYFLEDSNHAFVFDNKKYCYYPKVENQYLRFEKCNDNDNITETVKLTPIGNNVSVSLQYSTSENLWFDYVIDTPITIVPGQYVEFRNKYDINYFSTDADNYYHFVLSGGSEVKISGNISSLLNFSAIGITVTSATSYLFTKLFIEEDDLKDACDLNLDINKIPYLGYAHMFKDCFNMKDGPEINAFSGSQHCFAHMFHGCAKMETGPSNIFRNIDTGRTIDYPSYCCVEMFNGCTKLKYGPYLEKSVTCKTTFNESCFGRMFDGCTSLVRLNEIDGFSYIGGSYYDTYYEGGSISVNNSSELPYLACYKMFAGCSSLIKTPKLEPCYVDIQACYGMYSGCTSLTDAYFEMQNLQKDAAHVDVEGCAYMFIHCSTLTKLNNIILSGTSLSDKCYFYMFANCTNIGGFPGGNAYYTTKLPYMPVRSIPPSGCAYMYYKCFGNPNNPNFLNQFVSEGILQVDNFGMAHMFDSCEYLDTYPIERTIIYKGVPITIKSSSGQCVNAGIDAYIATASSTLNVLEYYISGQKHFTTIAYYSSYNGDVPGYASHFELISQDADVKYNRYYIYLNASELNDSCYAYMFNECNHLHYANHIILPEPILAPYCYDHMFYDCDELFAIPMLSAVTMVNTCSMRSMFANCSSVKGNNNLGYWKDNHFNEYTTHYNSIGNDDSISRIFYKYYNCKKGLFSIQKNYFYTFSTNGKFHWNCNDSTYANNGDYISINYSGNVISAASKAWLLSKVSTASDMTSKSWSIHAMFKGDSGMCEMFKNCYGLTDAYFKVFSVATTLPSGTFHSMFLNNFSLDRGFRFGFDVASNENVSALSGSFAYMFKNCFEAKETFIENTNFTTNTLRANYIGHAAYAHMYNNCYKLTYGPKINASVVSESSCAHMFNGCWRLKGLGTSITNLVSVLPATVLAENCYYSMFQDCHLLESPPGLPAQQSGLRSDCYAYMFNRASLRYCNGHVRLKLDASIRAQATGSPYWAGTSVIIDNRTYGYSPDKQNGATTLNDQKFYAKFFGNEFYYFLTVQETLTSWINISSNIGVFTSVYLVGDFVSKKEPMCATTWSHGISRLYYYDTSLNAGETVSFNHGEETTTNSKLSMDFYGIKSYLDNKINETIGVGTQNFYSKNYNITYTSTTNYNVSGCSDNKLYANAFTSDTCWYYTYSNFSSMKDAGIIGGADKFAIWVPDGSSPPSGYKRYSSLNSNANSHIWVPSNLYPYKLRQQYRVTTLNTDGNYYQNYYDEDIYFPNGGYWDNKHLFRTPTTIRFLSGNDYLFRNFNIPLDNSAQTMCSLSVIKTSASTLNDTYSKGWVNGLNHVNGTLYVKPGGNIEQGVNGLSSNWTKVYV